MSRKKIHHDKPGYEWYVMRVTYSRAMLAKTLFENYGMETFVPMTWREYVHHGKRVKKQVPVLNNYIFVYGELAEIGRLKRLPDLYPLVRYMMDKNSGQPVVVPSKQMNDFIAVSGTYDEQVMYLMPDEHGLVKGDLVTINSGIWKGVMGRLLRVKDGYRVVVELLDLLAVATVTLHPSMVDLVRE